MIDTKLMMAIVTEEEYRIIEEIFLPKSGLAPKMSGEAFVLFYDAIRKRVASCRETVENQPRVQACYSTGMDGLRFLWNFFQKNFNCESNENQETDEIIEEPQEEPTTSEEPPEMEARCCKPKGTNGLRFLWNFFSKNLPEEMDNALERRNDEVRRAKIPDPDKISLREWLIMERGDEENEDISSECSSISFVTASTKTCNKERALRYIRMMSPPLPTSVPSLGPLARSPMEQYLTSPSDDENESLCNFFEENNEFHYDTDEWRNMISWARTQNYFYSREARMDTALATYEHLDSMVIGEDSCDTVPNGNETGATESLLDDLALSRFKDLQEIYDDTDSDWEVLDREDGEDC